MLRGMVFWRYRPTGHGLTALLVLLVLVPGARGALAAGPLHEPVPIPRLRCEGGVCQREGEDAASLPEAVMSDGALLRPPTRPETPGESEPIFNAGALRSAVPTATAEPAPGVMPPPTRRTLVSPDRRTATEPRGERPYHETFNPAVFPFKRMTVLDAVDEAEALRLRDPRLQPLPVSGPRLQPRRDPFFATVVVDLQAGRPVPLPSPAAGLRLLSYAATPPTPLRFSRDGADNLYVTAEVTGRRRLVYLVDAEQRYFAGPLLAPGQPRPRLRDVVVPAESRLPRGVQRRADEVLQRLGLSPEPSADYQAVLDRLVGYFRGFELGELPSDRGSTYLDLALSQRGVCRHRAYAFVITALGAGIPARYVENELHVYAEVLVPSAGGAYWRRVHLGGAPLEQRVVDGEDKVAYQEKGGDPFPQPLAFRSTPSARVRGTTPRTQAEDSATGAGGGGPGRRGRGAGASAGGGVEDSGTAAVGPGERAGRPGPAMGNGARGAGEGAQGAAERGSPGAPGSAAGVTSPREGGADPGVLASVTIAPAVRRQNLHRGELLRIQGRAPSPVTGDAAIDLILRTPERDVPLGETRCGPDGRFSAEVEIPMDAPLGAHPIVARVRAARPASPAGAPRVQPPSQ